ncbi:MAG: cache domain-containing protein [Anaerolineaceae bacterium]|nr:cache domain-containing protein [Anaerolineaceae bacterium]
MIFGKPRQFLLFAALTLLLSLLAAPVAAQTPCDSNEGRLADIHSREQLKAYVHCAAQHIEAVGWEQAAQDFETSAWMDGDVYLFAGTLQGDIFFVAGSGLAAGTNLWDLQDSEGVWSTRELARIASDFGEGFAYYRFTSRETGRDEPKLSYIMTLERDGEPAGLGAGYHPRDTHGSCSPEVVRASLVYTERDVERFVTCAEHHLRQRGLQAIHEFNTDPRWKAGPTYLFLFDLEELFTLVNAGQPQLVGTVRDAAAYAPDQVPGAPETRRILASHDDGYVYYTFRNPATEEEGRKIAYFRRLLLDGRSYYIGSGLYVPADDCRNLPLARDIDTRDEMQQYVRCAQDLVDERGDLAWDLFLNHPQWIGGSAYIFVLDELCRQLVYPLDYERQQGDEPRCDLRDAAGNLPNQDILATARSEVGEGWVEYLWLNPASDEVETKHSFIVGGTLNGEHVSIGAGLYESQMQS